MSRFLPLATVFLAAASAAASAQGTLQVKAADGDAAVPGALTVIPGPPIQGRPQVHGNGQLMPGWPIRVPRVVSPNFAPSRGLLLADLDADGQKDVIATSTNSLIYAWNVRGQALPGWPVTVSMMPQYAPSVADIDGDGDLEVVQATRGLTRGGQIYVFHHDGTPAAGWPKSVGSSGNYVTASMTLVDLDNDGTLEIIAGERDYPAANLWVFNHDGSTFPGSWPMRLDHVPTGSASVGDLDGDGQLEIVSMSYHSMWAFERDGTVMPGWPYNVSTKHDARFSYQSAALADLTGDGKLEIVTACHWNSPGCYVFRFDGTLLPGWPKSWSSGWTYSPPTIADLDHDGRPEILCGGPASQGLLCWDIQGNLRPGFPFRSGASTEGPIIVANIDSDPELEILCDANRFETATGKGWLYAVDHQGNVEPGWPIRPTGSTYMNGCSVADVDGDGRMELAQISFDPQSPDAYVGLWKITGSSYRQSQVDWATYHENNRRTGRRGEGFRLTGSGLAALGQTYRLHVVGTPGSAFGLGASIIHANIPFAGFGVLHLDPAGMAFVRTGVIPADGTFDSLLPIPNLPALRGLRVHFQALEGIALTESVSIVVR